MNTGCATVFKSASPRTPLSSFEPTRYSVSKHHPVFNSNHASTISASNYPRQMVHPSITHTDAQKPRKLHLFGYPIVYSVRPYVHTFVTESVGLPWKCTHFETSDLDKREEAMKAEDFIAGAVTMPLNDDLAQVVGAVNTITVTTDKKLDGSNTDVVGIRDALEELSETGRNLPGMIIGAGRASRTAIYALLGYLDCSAVNRDPEKAKQVIAEMVASGFADAKEKIMVMESVEQAKTLEAPFCVVGEKSARAVADNLFRTEIPGSRGWVTIDEIEVLGLQLLEQRQLWLDPKVPLPSHAARQLMRDFSASPNVSSSVGFNQTL
ncbi:hypothetical protein ARMGADRAFT_1073889 [Armillaria gallica]|uniref:Uncharacterized protein n=1 Tax=Armillaria gallica TaxID=47427 RepID=A0A2H3DUS0_ARMGA|nr:hypothetical protein ARMGADRAFT_1073889 [Armillaria gallica]